MSLNERLEASDAQVSFGPFSSPSSPTGFAADSLLASRSNPPNSYNDPSPGS